ERLHRCNRRVPRFARPRIRRLDRLEGVFVRSGLEKNFVACEPVMPRKNIGLDQLKRVPHMRLRIDVRNSRGQIDFLWEGHRFISSCGGTETRKRSYAAASFSEIGLGITKREIKSS